MEHKYTFKDGSHLIVRDMTIEDTDLSYAFFNSIPEFRRRYFRSDVTNHEHIIERIKTMESGSIIRRIAIYNGKIVGDGSLEIATKSWKSGEAELRLVILPEYEKKEIQLALVKDFYDTAYHEQLNKIIAKFMRPQENLQQIYEEAGFKMEGILPNYVVDQQGKEQDMIIMVASLEDIRKAHHFIGDWLQDEHGSIGAGEM